MAYFQMQEDQNQEEILSIIKKRRNKYILFWCIFLVVAIALNIVSSFMPSEMVALVFAIVAELVAFASCVCASLVVWCINNYRYVKTEGRKQGGGLLWFIFFLLGGIILTILIVLILRGVEKLGIKALGL